MEQRVALHHQGLNAPGAQAAVAVPVAEGRDLTTTGDNFQLIP